MKISQFAILNATVGRTDLFGVPNFAALLPKYLVCRSKDNGCLGHLLELSAETQVLE